PPQTVSRPSCASPSVTPEGIGALDGTGVLGAPHRSSLRWGPLGGEPLAPTEVSLQELVTVALPLPALAGAWLGVVVVETSQALARCGHRAPWSLLRGQLGG
ncbi:MAG TPA: hypothetical protein VKY90_16095, partial [Candidatus Dormibacteraeota bacterium]|nr:hypothetical protein [Candidatus Dormibacteraeota bacterium]